MHLNIYKVLVILSIDVLSFGYGSYPSAERLIQDSRTAIDQSNHTNKLKEVTWAPDPKDLVGLYEEETLPKNTDAYFMSHNNTEVKVQVGSTATLRCQIFDVADHEAVSWIRKRDYHLLTVGSAIYSPDDRFQIIHSKKMQDWSLHIRYAQTFDAGMYECQLSAHPPLSIFTRLNVIEAISEISGGTPRHIQVGSSVHLSCVIKNFQDPPTYVFWYHGNEMINYDSRRRVTVDTNDARSDLIIEQVTPADSGNYTCMPSNAIRSSFSLHVITGETPAAMQKGSGTSPHYPLSFALLTSLFTMLSKILYFTDSHIIYIL